MAQTGCWQAVMLNRGLVDHGRDTDAVVVRMNITRAAIQCWYL
jgi:hypothetical protein